MSTCICASSICSTWSSSSVFGDVDLICAVLIFLSWGSAVAASVRCHTCPVGADLFWAFVVFSNILGIVKVWVVWITRLLSFSRIWTLAHQTAADAEHCAAWWVSDTGWYHVLVWWNGHCRVCGLSHVILATGWCCPVGAGAMMVTLSGCLLSKEAWWLLSSSRRMPWWCDSATLSCSSRSHRRYWTAFSTIFHML